MSGMYPDNQNTEIFGEQVSWPGVDASGKFTNGSFDDPMVKPSFIPAETINLILDNLTKLLVALNIAPNNKDSDQLARAILDALNLKANLASPTFTGTPKLPSKTAAAVNDGTLIATEAQVKTVADAAVETAKIKDGAITAAKIAANAVETAKIKNLNVTAEKLAANAVETDKIKDGAVIEEKIGAGAVTNSKIGADAVKAAQIKDGEVGETKLANNAVTRSKIKNGEVITDKIADLNVTTAKLANGAVTAQKLAAAISASEIADNAVTTAKIAPGAVTRDKVGFLVDMAMFEDGVIEGRKIGDREVRWFNIREGHIRWEHLNPSAQGFNNDMVEGQGRNLFDVLGIRTIPTVMAEIRKLCNNNGEIDNTSKPYFHGLMIGDYLDGLNLGGCTPPPDGAAPANWNPEYKNNRIVISGFNTLGRSCGAKNHVLFSFRNIICTSKVNYNFNHLFYSDSDLAAWLGNGSSDKSFIRFLDDALGGDVLAGVLRNSKKHNIFLPTEIETLGYPSFVSGLDEYETSVHFPIYARSQEFRIKKYNGADFPYWVPLTEGIHAGQPYFTILEGGFLRIASPIQVYGVSPSFCVG
jgi:hypothetical protein